MVRAGELSLQHPCLKLTVGLLFAAQVHQVANFVEGNAQELLKA